MSIEKLELKEYDPAEFINSPEDVLMYLNVVLEDNEPGELAAALGHIARSEGMAKIAEKTGIAREALYKALKAKSQPRFETLSKVANSLGYRFVLEPLNNAQEELAHS